MKTLQTFLNSIFILNSNECILHRDIIDGGDKPA